MNISSYPKIDPLSEKVCRPFWSVMIPTYNRIDYLEKTINSVLDQDPGPDKMQIEVVDNFSSKDLNIAELVREIGASRVLYYRQPRQVDFQENWSTCIRRSYGKYIHILHDDDMVLPGFYSIYKRFIACHSDINLVFSQAIHIDESDKCIFTYKPLLPDFPDNVIAEALPFLLQDNFIYSTSAIVPRRIYEKIGAFDPSLMHTVDWDMWLRISLEGPIGYIKQPLLAYRIHPHSGSKIQNNCLELIDRKYRDICYIINTYQGYLPPAIKKRYVKRFLKTFAISANNEMKDLLHQNKKSLAYRHAEWSKKLYPSPINRFRFLLNNIIYFNKNF